MDAPSGISATAASAVGKIRAVIVRSAYRAALVVGDPLAIFDAIAPGDLDEDAMGFFRGNEGPFEPGHVRGPAELGAGERDAGAIEVLDGLLDFVRGEGDVMNALAVFFQELEVGGIFAFEKLERGAVGVDERGPAEFVSLLDTFSPDDLPSLLGVENLEDFGIVL